MACVYYLKGKKFNSEILLDGELFDIMKLSKNNNDLVFSQQLLNKEKIKESSRLATEILHTRQKISSEQLKEILMNEFYGLDDPLHGNNQGIYISVTDILKGLQFYDDSSKAHYIFPKWVAEEYWNHMWPKLENLLDNIGKEDPETGKVFITQEFVDLMFAGEEPKNIVTEQEKQFYRARMERVWFLLSIVGNYVHSIFRVGMSLHIFDKIKSTTTIDDIIGELKKYTTKDREGNTIKPVEYNWDKATKENGEKEIGNQEEILKSIAIQIKQFALELKKRYKNPLVFPEAKVVGNPLKSYNSSLKIIGQIDLLVIDDDMNVDIYDYKCSPKKYSDFDEAKKLTFQYLLALYRRLVMQLELQGLRRIGINIVPILFANFSYADDGNDPTKTGYITINGINFKSEDSRNIIEDLDAQLKHRVEENLNLVMPEIYSNHNLENIPESLKAWMLRCFPDYADYKDDDEAKINERVLKYIENRGGITKSEENGKYYFFDKVNNKSYVNDSELDIFNTIKNKFIKGAQGSGELASKLSNILYKAQKGESILSVNATGKLHDPEKGTFLFAEKILDKYANNLWEVITEDGTIINPSTIKFLLSRGVILVRNKTSNVIEVIKCSNDDLFEQEYLGPKYNRREYILGTFLSDDAQIGMSDSLALRSVKGNIELMETMFLLNAIPSSISKLGGVIGEIQVVNTEGYKGIGGLDCSNELLIYNFRRLCSLSGYKEFNISNGNDTKAPIHMCSYSELVEKLLRTILELSDKGYYKWFDDNLSKFYEDYKLSILEHANKEKVILQLTKLKEQFESKFEYLKGKPKMQENYSNHPEYKIYNDILLAIAELNNINVVQQLENNPRFFKSLKTALQEGINGSLTDNPGTWQSQNLNKMAYATERAYQNVRVLMSKFDEKLRQEVKLLKEAKSFSWLSKVTIGNLAGLYLNLYDSEMKKNGMLQFKELNDPSLSAEEQRFLNFAVRHIALKRYGEELVDENGNFSELAFLTKYNNDKQEVLQVPLIRGDFASKVAASGGYFNAIKISLQRILPSNIKKTIVGLFYEFLDVKDHNSSQKEKAKSGELYEMINRIKNSFDPDLRERLLVTKDEKSNDVQFHVNEFETNLEKILLTTEMAYDMESEINKVFPLLKAIVAGLTMQGAMQNTDFDKDIDLAINYIKNKIHNLPLEDMDLYGVGIVVTKELMSISSKIALAFNIRLLYQILDGIWKDIMLCLSRPDVDIPDESAFTRLNLLDSFFWIIKDAWHFGDKVSLGEALNNLYGVNDMDMNVLNDRLSTDNAGLYNFWSVGFRFSSRPDYYNRMTIFNSIMRKDGCFEAHSINEKGELIYDWTKDKRFDLYANHKEVGSDEWKKLKSLYLTMAQEFIREGAIGLDGKLFQIGNDDKITALPRAYTTKQSENIKAIADKIYGYYSHEKRSMIQSFTLGAIFLQMHTYWSSKKNQYFAGHTFTQQGDFEQYTEQYIDDNGLQLTRRYWVNEEGLPTEENTGVPYLVWSGRPQEGIIISLINMARDVFRGQLDEDGSVAVDENGKLMKGWSYMHDKYFGEKADKKIKALYRANVKKFAYDMFMWILIGEIIARSLLRASKTHAKENINDTLYNAFMNSTLLNLSSMFFTSTEDFNFVKSVFGLVTDWNPFSFSMMERAVKMPFNLFFSDKDSYDILVDFPSSTRNILPIMDYAKFSVTGRLIGEREEE